jgi:hypothetical protein
MIFNQLTRQPGNDQVQELAVDQGNLTHLEGEDNAWGVRLRITDYELRIYLLLVHEPL